MSIRKIIIRRISIKIENFSQSSENDTVLIQSRLNYLLEKFASLLGGSVHNLSTQSSVHAAPNHNAVALIEAH